MPFRQTHHVSGRAVALAETTGRPLSELTLAELKSLSSLFESDVTEVFDFESSVEKRDAIGGTSRRMVERQVQVIRDTLKME
jgi:argininosuccinate lyase